MSALVLDVDRAAGHVAGGPEVDQLLEDAAHDRLPAVLVVVGPGGSGKSWLLGRLAGVLRGAGRRAVDGGALTSTGSGRTVVLVDDAHHLTEAAAERVLALADDPGRCTVVAHRPGATGPGLARLLTGLARDRRTVRLGHLERDQVARWLAAEVGPVPDRVLDAVVEGAGGLPALVARHVAALAVPPVPVVVDARGGSRHGNVVATLAAPAGTPSAVGRHVRSMVAALDDGAAGVLRAVAAGAPWDGGLLAELLDREVTALRADLDRARGTGLVRPDGVLPPVVREALLASVPPGLVTELRRRLVRLLADGGADPVPVARALADDGVPDRRAAAVLTGRAAAELHRDPAAAGRLLDQAMAAGATGTAVAALRAEAAGLAGDADGALRWADAALRDATDDDRPEDVRRAAGVSGVLLAARGLPGRSAELLRRAGPDRSGAAALVLLGSGHRGPAGELLAGPGAGEPLAATAAGERLMATAVLQTLEPAAAVHGAVEALSSLAQAEGLLEPVEGPVLLPDTPAAIAALVALHTGDSALAGSLLRRALTGGTGAPATAARHRLLLAWAAMLAGRPAEAEPECAAVAGGDEEPRNALFRAALRVGLARRRGDLAGLIAAWEPAREALVRHPLDLFTLLPMGELVVAAARLRHSGQTAHLRGQAAELLDRLGRPPVWSAAWHWYGVQAAILAEDPAALEPHAAALVAAAPTSPPAGVLARAGRTWLRVLRDEAPAAEVVAAAEALGRAGWSWDGSRLAGHAAARAREAADRGQLLQCARALAGPGETDPVPGPADEATPPAAGRLSAREREVAELVVAGVTYREIGSRLFISAKTVEHHVARMRQRLGAADRSELLAVLRAELGG